MPATTKDDVIEAEEHGKSLNEDEILAVWRAASAIGGPFGGLVKMGLSTGLRRGELAAMRWDWIDRNGLKITVPGNVMKNGREHTVAITTEGVKRDPTATVTATVTRDGNTFPITFLPRGKAVDAFQWERDPSVPDSECRG